MSWLSDRTGIHWNLRPYAAAAGGVLGGLVGGPLGAGLGAALFKTADNKAHGDGWEHALGQGALNGALAYGTAGLMGGGAPGAGSSAGEVAPDMTNAFAAPGVQQGVMSRVMGGAGNALQGAGSFVKNNHELLTTGGSLAQGVLGAQAQNRQSNVAQQEADAQTAQIQAAIDKQKAVQAAFQSMYGRGIGGPPPSSAPTAPSSAAPSRTLTPTGPAARMVVPDDGSIRLPDQGGDTTNAGSASGPADGSGKPAGDPNAALAALLKRLGYQPPPTSPYAGNDSQWGSPFGSGYTSMNYGGGGY